MTTIDEKNIEIAKMLGWVSKGMKSIPLFIRFKNDMGVSVSDLNFKDDWNELMKVVMFIEEMDIIASIQIDGNSCFIWASSEESNFEDIEYNSLISKKDAVYNAVSEFAKKYNNNEL